MIDWLSIKDDGLPKTDGSYIICSPSADPENPLIAMGWYDPTFGWSLLPQVWIDGITHYMPRPAAPRGTPQPPVDFGDR